jgi:polyprenyl-phospho-N-acetylgalactosaminyl synthase
MAANDVWIVIAAFQEEEVIAPVLRAVAAKHPNVVVVDDGSPDQTATRAVAAGAVVLRHPFNLGQGAALQTGIDYALRRGAKRIVTFDADGQHCTEDIDVLLSRLDEGFDIVFGSRFLGRTQNLPFSRRLLIKLAVIFTFCTTGLRLTDTHNGLRAMTASTARKIRLRHNGMAHASEIFHLTASLRLNFAEAPVTVVYSAYSLAKGQRLGNALSIVVDLIGGRMQR